MTLLNLGYGNLAESAFWDSNPLVLPSEIGRIQGVLQYQSTVAGAQDIQAIYPPGILTGSGMACLADVVVRVVGMKSDNTVAGSWHRGVTVKWDAGGTPTIIGAEYELRPEQGTSGHAFTLPLGSGGVLLRLTPATATTINWVFEISMLTLDNIP